MVLPNRGPPPLLITKTHERYFSLKIHIPVSIAFGVNFNPYHKKSINFCHTWNNPSSIKFRIVNSWYCVIFLDLNWVLVVCPIKSFESFCHCILHSLKMHKNPYNQFIAGSSKCLTKALSVLLTKLLTCTYLARSSDRRTAKQPIQGVGSIRCGF